MGAEVTCRIKNIFHKGGDNMYVYTVYYVSASGLAPVPLKTFDSMDKAKDFIQKPFNKGQIASIISSRFEGR